VRHELSMRQRLVRASHDAESNMLITLFHKGRNNRVERTFAGSHEVGTLWVQGEECSSVLQNETHAAHRNAGSKQLVVTLNQGNDVAFAIHCSQISSLTGGWGPRLWLAVRALRVDQLGPLFRILFRD